MIKLEIVLDDKGAVNVSGPLEDKILCFGLIELAKTVITTYKARENNIIKVPPGAKVVDLKQGH